MITALLLSPNIWLWAFIGLLLAGGGLSTQKEDYTLQDALETLYLGSLWAFVVYLIFTLLNLQDYINYSLIGLLAGSFKPKYAWGLVYGLVMERVKNAGTK